MAMCPACGRLGSDGGRPTVHRYRIHACPACRSEYCLPRKAAVAGHYEALEVYGERWEFRQALRDLGPPGELIEIGCGEGHFLSLATQAGFRVTGIDINRKAVAKARLERGIEKVYPLDLDQFLDRHGRKRFDHIAFFHVLEHLPSPYRFLRTLCGMLRPGGRIAFSVPNPDRWRLKLGDRESWDYPPHHLTRFSRAGIVKLLERAGLRLLRFADEPVSLMADLRRYFVSSVEHGGMPDPPLPPRPSRYAALSPLRRHYWLLNLLGLGFALSRYPRLHGCNGTSLLVGASIATVEHPS